MECFKVSRKISAGWNTFHVKSVRDGMPKARYAMTVGSKAAPWWGSRGRSLQKPQKFGIFGVPNRGQKTVLMTGDDHNPQKLNFDFTFHGKIIIKFISHRKAVDHDSRELIFDFTLQGKIISQFTSHGNALDHEFTGTKFLISHFTGHGKALYHPLKIL